MGSNSKTPGRLGPRSMPGVAMGDEGYGAAAASAKADTTVDIGALMRKKRLLVGTSGVGGGGLPSSRGAAAPASSHFAAGLGLDVSVENPVYSPDDSLAKAASKLQSLKALRATPAHPLAQSSGSSAPAGPLQPSVAAPGPAAQAPPGRAAVAAPAAAAAAAGGQMAAPPAQPCDSPPVHDIARHASQSAEAGQRLSDEDSGELAALSALQRRRRSVAPGSAQKRYGSWFEGDDRELEHTLHEYNRGAPASPRMTRAQRRKSLAVDRSLALEPGLAKAALGEAAGDAQQPQPQPLLQQQQGKPAGGAWRKSMAAAQQVVAQPAAEIAPAQGDSVAAEVAALNAELCAQLDGVIEDSPDKKSRGDGQSLRDKLLQSWDGRTYYERLLEMSQDKEHGGQGSKAELQGRQQQAQAAQQPRQPGGARQPTAAQLPAPEAAEAAATAAPEQLGKSSSRTPGPAKQAASAPGPPAPRPARLQLAGMGAGSGSGSGVAKALLTPNSQRRKLNELTTSLQLLKVTSRHRGQPAAAAAQSAGADASTAASAVPAPAPGTQAAQAAPTAGSEVAAAGSRTPGRSRSASPEAAEQPPAAAAKTGSRRRSRRGTTPPTEASIMPPAAVAGQAAPALAAQAVAAQADTMRGEVAAAYEMLNAALADRDKLGDRLKRVEAELAAERAQRQAAQEEAARLRQELEQARHEHKEEAAAAKSGRQQLAMELAEVQASAAAVAERASEAEALAQRCAEAEKALSSILRAANSGLKAAATGREEAKALVDALRRGEENAGPVPTAGAGGSTRQLRQSGGGRQWR